MQEILGIISALFDSIYYPNFFNGQIAQHQAV